MNDQHLSVDDMPLFTALRMTAFGEAVIDIANDPACDQWSFSQKIRHALEQETTARTERRVLKLLKASRTPNPAACVEDIHYLDGRNLNRDLIERLAACRWIDRASSRTRCSVWARKTNPPAACIASTASASVRLRRSWRRTGSSSMCWCSETGISSSSKPARHWTTWPSGQTTSSA